MDSRFLEGLTEDQKAALKKTKTREELLELIDSSGFELSVDQLEAINGGCCNCDDYCCHQPAPVPPVPPTPFPPAQP